MFTMKWNISVLEKVKQLLLYLKLTNVDIFCWTSIYLFFLKSHAWHYLPLDDSLQQTTFTRGPVFLSLVLGSPQCNQFLVVSLICAVLPWSNGCIWSGMIWRRLCLVYRNWSKMNQKLMFFQSEEKTWSFNWGVNTECYSMKYKSTWIQAI